MGSKRVRPSGGREFEEYERVGRHFASKRYVKRALMQVVEKKCLNVTPSRAAAGVLPIAGQIDTMQSFAIVQGVGNENRTGNQIVIDKLVCRWQIESPVGNTGIAITYRVIFFVDRQFNGVVPVVADILETASPFSGYNDDYVDRCGGQRFRVLKDVTRSISPFSPTAGAGTQLPVKHPFLSVLKGPFKIQFDAAAGAPTDIVSGEICCLVIADIANGCVLQGAHQFFFRDI